MLTPKPWRADRIVWLVAALLASISLGTLVVQGYQALLPKDEPKGQASLVVMLIGTLMFHGVALALVGVFLRQHQLTWSEAFGFNAPRRKRAILLAVLTSIVVLPIAWSLGQLSQVVLLKLGLTPQAQQAVQALTAANSLGQQIYFFIVAVLLAPVVEEIIFRGILYTALKHFGFPTFALWGASLAFALMHTNMMTFLPLLFFAVILTFLYETTGNLLSSIIAHSLFNATNFILLLWQAGAAVKS
jgi:membrane protease YdiL (CAAX protease family)